MVYSRSWAASNKRHHDEVRRVSQLIKLQNVDIGWITILYIDVCLRMHKSLFMLTYNYTADCGTFSIF